MHSKIYLDKSECILINFIISVNIFYFVEYKIEKVQSAFINILEHIISQLIFMPDE